MNPTTRYNDKIKAKLDALKITYRDFGGTLWVNRDSLCNALPSDGIPEETVYPKVMAEIKRVIPSVVHAMWGGQNDNEVMLEIWQ